MKEEEVIRAATEYAEREGWRVDDYEVSSAAKEGARYRVRFEGKSGRVGDHFSVVVDASTGQATQLIPGR